MVVAVFSMSTSVIMIKLSRLEVPVLTAGRLLLSVALLFPLMESKRRAALREGGPGLPGRWWLLGLFPGLLFSVHLITWAMGARMTNSANATLAVNTVPLVLPFLLHWIAHERVTRKELFGTGIAFTGLVVLTAADARLDAEHFRGDLVCLGSMLFLAVYLALGRRLLPQLPSPWLYAVPLYLIAALASLPFAWGSGSVQLLVGPGALREWAILAGLAVVPTIFGHGLTMVALKVLRGQVVAVMSLGQFMTAGLMAWLVFGEQPHGLFYVAALLVATGCSVVILGKK